MLRVCSVGICFLLTSLVLQAAEKVRLQPGVYNGEFAVTNRNMLSLERGPITIVVNTNRHVFAYIRMEGPEFTGNGRRIAPRRFRTAVRWTLSPAPSSAFATILGKAESTNVVLGRLQCHFPPLGRGTFTAERYTGGDTSGLTDFQRGILEENGF
jgi:hypothetical protein